MGIRITFAIKGLAELQAEIQRLRAAYPGAAAAAVYVEGVSIMRRARSLAPVDTSLLINSAWCALPNPKVADPICRMGFSAPYALAVHELVENRHPHGGEANFLRKPFEAALGGYARRLLSRMIAYVRDGVLAPQPDSSIPTAAKDMVILMEKTRKGIYRQKGSKSSKERRFARVQRALGARVGAK